jgi:phospholipid transport system substrate-binding protein
LSSEELDMSMTRRTIAGVAATLLCLAAFGAQAQAAKAPEALIKEVSTDVLDAVKADKTIRAGDIRKVITLVDQKVLPYVNFERMTSSAVGRYWRQATPEQQKRLQEEFKLLLVRTYAGALDQVTDQAVTLKPFRGSPDDKDVLVRTEVRGASGGEPIQLDYRLEKTPGEGSGWKIYNLNVMGIWLVDTYRTQFAQEINSKGIDGLIAVLAARNKGNSAKS